nr:hypothetical conserved protein [uncultured Gammaproteobacteria bacterium]
MEWVAEAEYRIPYRLSGVRPGAHRGSWAGAGSWFLGVTEFLRYPDARRLDLRRSLLDPFLQLYVKVFEQRLAATVVIAADLSASLGVSPHKRKTLLDLSWAVAASARRLGDRFGFCGFDTQLRQEFTMPPLTTTSWLREMLARLKAHPWSGGSALGARELASWLPPRRSLVFLISDFYWPQALLHQVVTSLKSHWVVPVVVWCPQEFMDWPQFGLRQVVDAETGKRRLVVLTPTWHRRLKANLKAWRNRLERFFRTQGLSPLWLATYDPMAVRRYFQALC